MTLLDERSTYRLNPDGVAVLLVYGAKLFPPAVGPDGSRRPGIRVTVDAHGTCLLEAVGYANHEAANLAICAAAQTCLDADLIVSFAPTWVDTADRSLARVVRRRPS